MIVAILGVLSSVLSFVVFLTGKPSIHHFLPILPTSERRIPSPFVKWRFIVRDNTLLLRTGSLEVALLHQYGELGEYRIFVSAGRKKVMVVYNASSGRFGEMVVANFDGSHRQVHQFPYTIIVDARWFDDDTYLVFLLEGYPYPKQWQVVDAGMMGEKHWYGATTREGNYLVTLDETNEVVGLRRY
jgi:hypothetical protein